MVCFVSGLLGPMGVLGGNFIPPLGVPPPVPGLLMSGQHMVNRLPPPFPGRKSQLVVAIVLSRLKTCVFKIWRKEK